MAGRQAHGRSLSKMPKAKVNSKKRSLDAFSIATQQNPDRIKIKQNRLGVTEGGNRPGKRRRDENDDEDEEEETNTKKLRKGPEKGRFDELDLDEGSDSEGNEWKLGQVDSDDDSDLDSEEAFGESDEERFEGFAFSGSTDKKSKKKKPAGRSKDVSLNEDEEEDSDSELEEGDLGEGAVDLADMLDASSGDEEDSNGLVNGSGSEEEGDDSDDESSTSSADENDDTTNPAKIAALQSLIANLPQVDESNRGPAKQRSDGASEYNTPSDFGLTPKAKLTLEDLGLPSISDPNVKKSLKLLESQSKGKKVAGRLEVPLARRQQDRLDRSAAYDKSKETLDRWTDTVKHNRRADHLMFPLPDNDTLTAQSNKQLQPTNLSKPFNELEATIQSILEESGLATANGKDDEDRIREFEELETKKLSVEEVKARRDQLRMARELLFREEAKAKRIKKIKSKSYRKVHRKQREKEDRLNREALAEGGFEPSEDELEAQDRRRAEERMGGRHRGSKWAKAMEETGRTAWDEDARSGVTEMARRDEELRKRVEGRAVRKEFDNESDESVSDSEDMSEDDDEAEQRRLLKKLQKVGADELVDESAPGSKLANMKFMRKADAARKQQNDAMVENMRREFAGEDSASEEEQGDIGRRIFGPGSAVQEKPKSQKRYEFEEQSGSDDEEVEFERFNNPPASPKPTESIKSSKVSSITDIEAKRRRHKKNSTLEIEDLDLTNVVTASQPKSKKPPKKIQTLDAGSEPSSDDENKINLPFAIKDQDLIKRAFAGADVVGEFSAEKKQTIEDEDEKVVDNTLPGWGSWVGSGVSKKDKARNKGRFLSTVAGVKEKDRKDRKDAKLDKVIINEKKVKKNNKYLASSLPHPFETKQQYERTLRLPIGPEWSTKATFQDATKPRILLKQGIIAPMSKPLL